MKSFKSTEKNEQRGLVAMENTIKEIPEKIGAFFSGNKKRTIIICCTVLLIGTAIFLNWKLFGSGNNQEKDYETGEDGEASATPEDSGSPIADGGTESYFAMAVIDREKARDEALEVLNTLATSKDAAENEKQQAIASIARIAGDIEAESNIETLVKAKGFSECVAVVSQNGVSVIVKCDASLMPNELVQIQEIVYEQSGVLPGSVNIIEKKPN